VAAGGERNTGREPNARRGVTLPPRRGKLAASRPAPVGSEDRMAGFLFRLEAVDDAAADPATLEAAVPDWKAGDSIYFGGQTLRVIGTRDDDADQPPVLIVEEAS
jgi:hypothetical protein